MASFDPQCLSLTRQLDMTSTADQSIPIAFSPGRKYRVWKVTACNSTASLNLAVGGIYTGPGKTGIQVVSALQTYALLTDSNDALDLVVNSSILDELIDYPTLYLSLTVPQLSPALCDFYVYGMPIY